jgi:hypothetical protein
MPLFERIFKARDKPRNSLTGSNFNFLFDGSNIMSGAKRLTSVFIDGDDHGA